MQHPVHPVQFIPSKLVLWQFRCFLKEGDRWIRPTMPILLTYHNVDFLLSCIALCPTWPTSLSGIWSIFGLHLQRSSVWFSLYPQPVKRDFCAGPHDSILYNQQNGMTTQANGFVTSMMLLHFCIELHCWAFWDLQSGCWNLYLYSERGKCPHLLQRGSIW